MELEWEQWNPQVPFTDASPTVFKTSLGGSILEPWKYQVTHSNGLNIT